MVDNEEEIIWIDGVPYIVDRSTEPPSIALHPDYHPTIRFRIKHLYWGFLCKVDEFKMRIYNKIYNLWRMIYEKITS